MAERRRNNFTYHTDGSAAYQVDYVPGSRESTARPLPKQQPKPHKKTRKKPVVHEKIAIAPFAVLGVALALFMLVLVLFGYVQIYEAGSEVANLEDRIATLQEENKKLQTQFENAVDLQQIEQSARELGMQQPSSKQKITVRVPVEDVTVISAETGSNPIETAVRAIYETAQDLLEYLRLR